MRPALRDLISQVSAAALEGAREQRARGGVREQGGPASRAARGLAHRSPARLRGRLRALRDLSQGMRKPGGGVRGAGGERRPPTRDWTFSPPQALHPLLSRHPAHGASAWRGAAVRRGAPDGTQAQLRNRLAARARLT